MGSLNNLYISQSFQSLAHLGTDAALVPGTMTLLQDGIGQSLNISFDGTNISSSGNIYGANITASTINTASFVSTSSFNSYTSSTNIRLNNLESTSASVNVSINNLNAATQSYITETESGSFLITASFNTGTRNLTFTKGDNSTFAVNIPDVSGSIVATGSLLVTASASPTANTITFTKGDATTFDVVLNITASASASFNTGSFLTTASFNSYTSSTNIRLNNLESTTASLNTSITNLNLSSASQQVSINNINTATASLFISAGLALVTASISNDDITFTKGDGSQFTIQVATGSFALSASYADTASLAVNALDIIVNAKNTTGAQLNKGTVVRIIGATGDNPLIGTASWTDDDNSANTLGFVITDIPNDSFGRVMTQGTLLAVDTDPVLGYAAGQLVYLSGSGQYTNIKPPAPYHEVRLGQVLRAQQNNGSIYVLIQNGYELTELHDVDINTASLANNDLLAYNSASGQWENKTLTQVGATTTASFNAYTSSTNVRLNNIEITTASLNTSITNLNLSSASQQVSIDSINQKTGSFATTGSNQFIGNQIISGTLDVSSSFTASLQNGYVWVGNSSGRTTTVATSSFGGGSGAGFPFTGSAEITGSLAITGSLRGFTNTLSVVSSTASINMNDGNFFTLTLPTGSTTHVAISNLSSGQTINLLVSQSLAATGSIAFAPNIRFAGGVDYTATAITGAMDIVSFVSFDTNQIFATQVKNLS